MRVLIKFIAIASISIHLSMIVVTRIKFRIINMLQHIVDKLYQYQYCFHNYLAFIFKLSYLTKQIQVKIKIRITTKAVLKQPMTDISYDSRSLSQLVSQLHNFGDNTIQIKQNTLIAIHESDQSSIRRYKVKSKSQTDSNKNHRSTLTSEQSHPLLLNGLQNNPQATQENGQFFLVANSQKKYNYHEVQTSLGEQQVDNVLEWVNYGYNTNIIIQAQFARVKSLISNLNTWTGDCQGIVSSFYQYTQKSLVNLFTSTVCDHSNFKSIEYHSINLKFLQKTINQSLNSKNPSQTVKILRLYTLQNKSELRIIMLPDQFLNLNSKNQVLQLVRKQISQILNYLKLNPSKRYEQISKLITKRHWITNVLNDLFLGESVNFIFNFVNQVQNHDENYRIGKFQLYDKFFGIKNLVRSTRSNFKTQQIVIKPLQNIQIPSGIHTQKTSKSKNKNSQSVLKHHHTQQTKSRQGTQSPNNQYRSQLDYCRDLQRKTHKYSILNEQERLQDSFDNQIQRQLPEQNLFSPNFSNNNLSTGFPAASVMNLQQQTSPKSQTDQNYFFSSNRNVGTKFKSQLNNQSQNIAILKARHARQISQYHTTIQNLNKKILVLTKERGLQQLFTIHQRQIMMLQLKIKELRGDISAMCSEEPNLKNKKTTQDTKQLKNIIKRLNQQIRKNDDKTSTFKISQGKIKLLQKQLQQCRNKQQKSQIARKNLTDEINALRKRLEINDALKNPIKAQKTHEHSNQQLAYRDEQVYNQFSKLLENLVKTGSYRNQQKKTMQYVKRKILGLLQDLSQSRDIILECNNFLIELQSHLQGKLGQKDPEVVLDCNRFIRGFLLGNLSVL